MMNRLIQVRNPRTGEHDYEFAATADPQVKARASQLRQANQRWQSSGLEHRIETLRQWKTALAEHRSAIIGALTTDTGRHLASSIEVDGLAPMIDRWITQAATLITEQEGRSAALPQLTFRSQFVPYELVGVISPWNFPVLLSLIDAIPALVAGCSVAIKPSEVTPRFIEPLCRSIESVSALNEVLAILPGDGATGAALINEVDAVCFTGSVKTGRLVAEAAARHFIPAFLELGGKDPAIITASADLERAATVVLRASVFNTGQACQSLERVYVEASVYDNFVARLVELAQSVTLNFPDIHQGQIGPLIFNRQAEIIAEQLANAIAQGAQILTGGKIETHGGGKWIRPTVITGVTHNMKLMTEETFGPIIPIMKFHTVAEAIALANDSEYGLSAAVFAGSVEEAEAIARRINAGAVSINDGALTGLMHEAEKNSFRLSGLGGSRMGAAGMLRFFRKKALIFQTGQPATLAQFDERNAMRR
jgi:acyl-CoA reductase-like NAD-dependent aldehyde dehydrogenase